MPATRLLMACGIWVACCGIASASGIIDPAMAMEAGSFSHPLSQFPSFPPDPITGGGVVDLFNDTGFLITSLEFQTLIKPHLTGNDVGAFTCSVGSNAFFLNCGYVYDPGTGLLSLIFSGVNPPDGDEFTSPEIGDREGIPPLAPGCTPLTADTAPCVGQGHFAISFNNDFNFTGAATGGWSASLNPGLFSGPPVFLAPLVNVPEPSSLLLAAAGLMAVAALSRRRVRGDRMKQ